MRNLLLWFIIIFSFKTISAQITQPIPFINITDVNGNEEILVDCDYPVDDDRCFVLKADYTVINETTSYGVSAIDYQDPISGLTNDAIVNVGGDDVWSSVLNLPFTFCFFNDSFDQFVLGDNGVITFDTSVADLESQFIRSQIPSGNLIGNAIFGVFHDMLNVNKDGCFDDPSTPENECGEIKLYTTGAAPQRAFIISYEGMNHFACEDVKSTTQIVLYESSNVIEVYVKEKPENCEAVTPEDDPDVVIGILNRKNALIGLQNSEKNDAYFPPERNNSEWTATNEAWRFTPNGTPVTTVVWKNEAGETVGTDDELIICPEVTTTYTATVIYDVCIGEDVELNDAIPITIDISYPVATDVDEIICDTQPFDEQDIDLSDFEAQLVGSQTGLLVSYHNSEADARNNNNALPENQTLTGTSVFYARLQRGVSCFDIGTVTLRLTRVGVAAVPEIAVCDQDNDATEIIDLTDYSSELIGAQPNMNISYYFTQEDADNNTNSQTELVVVPGSSIFVRYTIGAEELCPNVVEVPVRLKEKPIVQDIPIELCDHILIYDLTLHEDDILADNTLPISFSYHLSVARANSNTNPIEEEDLEQFVHNERAVVYVRAQGPEGCHEVFELQFTYLEGSPANDDEQVQLSNPFDLTQSIIDMIGVNPDLSVQFIDCDTGDPIPDPENYTLPGAEGEVCVIFTNLASGCESVAAIGLTATGGGGFGGGGGFASCDFGGDGIETFTLSDFTEEIINNATFDYPELLEVSFHLTAQQAEDDTDEIFGRTITGDETIFIRVSVVFEENELDHWVEEMILEFKPATTFDDVEDSICDVRDDNRERVDLTSYEAEILDGETGDFTYFTDSGDDILDPENYLFVGPQQFIQIIVATPDGCEIKAGITLTFTDPIPATNTSLEACDFDDDNQEFFDFADALPDINPDYEDYTFSYYNSQADADEGNPINAIPDPNNYLLDLTTRRIYVRLEESINCYTTALLDLRIITAPILIESNITTCDFLNDGIETDIELNTFDQIIKGTQGGVTVTYYETEQNAIDDIDPITSNDITPTTTLYVSLVAGVKCKITSPITFNFIDTPVVSGVAVEVIVCDNEVDGEETYNLQQHESEAVTDLTNVTITYYNTEEDAITESNRITAPGFYLIDTAPQSVYLRVEDNTTSCFSVAVLDIKFIFPTEVSNERMITCDISADGSEIFDVTVKLPEMIDSPENFDISYYTRRDAAATADINFELTDPENIDSAIASTIYVRFYDSNTGCYSIGEIVLELLKTPKLLRGEFYICDDDIDGEYTLNLIDINPQMIQDSEGLVFSYHHSYEEANEKINTIDTPDFYLVESSPERVYARVESPNGCFSVSFVDIVIDPKVSVEDVSEIMESCDDDRDELAIFNLTQFQPLFTTETGATFRYFNTRDDAGNLENEITDPTAHQNTTLTEQEVFVRVSVEGKCDDITSFTIRAIKITPNYEDVDFCDGDTYILDAGPGYTSYLWNTGATTQTIPVTEGGQYTITLQNDKGCAGTFPINVIKNPLPEVFIGSLLECDADTAKDGLTLFNLADANNEITDGNTTYSTHFYLSQNDLDNDNNELNQNGFRNTENPQVLFVKVQDNLTSCYSNTTLTLEVSFIDPNFATIEVCDELGSEDGIHTFDLSEASNQVLQGLGVSEVSYFESYDDATNNQNPLEELYTNTTPYSQAIYSRVINADNCIGVGLVRLTVNALPDIEEDEEVLYCLDMYPETMTLVGQSRGSSSYTYNWNTGETSPTIEINEVGEYSVTITNSDGCSKERFITVISSEIATIENIQISDKSQINSITVFATGSGDYEYSIDGSSYQDSDFFDTISPGFYTIYVRDKNGCGVVEESISVIGFPNFFTPNDDGYNDYWKPIGFSSEVQENMEVYIFDRYGKLLAKIDPNQGWDGTFNHRPLIATDYWYQVSYRESFSKQPREFRGHFSLVR